MMANNRLSVFEDGDGDVDLSAFAPKPDSDKPKPPMEQVRAVTEAARFRSREPAPAASVPPKRAPHYHKTGRTAQLNVRVMPTSFEKVYAIADRQGWLIGETVERALEALERELEGQATDHDATFPAC
jgi:hypothetical protein